MKRRKSAKVLSFILTLTMCLSLMPAMAFAEPAGVPPAKSDKTPPFKMYFLDSLGEPCSDPIAPGDVLDVTPGDVIDILIDPNDFDNKLDEPLEGNNVSPGKVRWYVQNNSSNYAEFLEPGVIEEGKAAIGNRIKLKVNSFPEGDNNFLMLFAAGHINNEQVENRLRLVPAAAPEPENPDFGGYPAIDVSNGEGSLTLGKKFNNPETTTATWKISATVDTEGKNITVTDNKDGTCTVRAKKTAVNGYYELWAIYNGGPEAEGLEKKSEGFYVTGGVNPVVTTKLTGGHHTLQVSEVGEGKIFNYEAEPQICGQTVGARVADIQWVLKDSKGNTVTEEENKGIFVKETEVPEPADTDKIAGSAIPFARKASVHITPAISNNLGTYTLEASNRGPRNPEADLTNMTAKAEITITDQPQMPDTLDVTNGEKTLVLGEKLKEGDDTRITYKISASYDLKNVTVTDNHDGTCTIKANQNAANGRYEVWVGIESIVNGELKESYDTISYRVIGGKNPAVTAKFDAKDRTVNVPEKEITFDYYAEPQLGGQTLGMKGSGIDWKLLDENNTEMTEQDAIYVEHTDSTPPADDTFTGGAKPVKRKSTVHIKPDVKPGVYTLQAEASIGDFGRNTASVKITVTEQDKPSGGGGSSSGGGSSIPSKPDVKPEEKPEIQKNPDGSVTETVKKEDGSTVATTKKDDGTVIETVTKKDGSVAAEVTVPKGKKNVAVSIPKKNLKPGEVAVIIKADGTKEVIKKSVAGENGLTLMLDGNAEIEIIDNTKNFNDVAEKHWAGEAVDFVTSREIFNGTGGGNFAPESTMTRGMLVKVLHNFENNPEGAAAGGFGDVSGNDWYADAVQWAASKGIVSGKGNGEFAPNDEITREQLAAILYRFAGQPAAKGNALKFADASEISSYAADAMNWAISEGLINGMGDNELNPKGSATRAQVAAIIMRFCEKTVK